MNDQQKYRQSPLELLETPVSEPEKASAADALEAGQLTGWNLRKVCTFAQDLDGTLVQDPSRYSILRDSEAGLVCLGNVGRWYQVVQNEDHAAFLDRIREESGAVFVGAGMLGEASVFVDMRLPGAIMVGGVDQVDMHLVAVNSHDGSSSFTLMTFPVRRAGGALLSPGILRIRHTSGAHDNLEALAEDSLNSTFGYLDRFRNMADALYGIEMDYGRFEEIAYQELGVGRGSSQAALTRAETKISDAMSVYAYLSTTGGLEGTAWTGYAAFTEWFDHYSPTRGPNPDLSRAQKALLDPSFKDHALKRLLAEL